MEPSTLRSGMYEPRNATVVLRHRSAADLAFATLVAAAGVAGSLYVTLGLGLKACPLCFYQRSFAMAALAVLLAGPALRNSIQGAAVAVLALLPAAAGLGVAGFHVSLEWRGKLECPTGVLGFGTVPQQSLAVFLLLAGTLAFAAARRAGGGIGRVLFALVLGAGMTWASISANPPPSKATSPDQPLDMCRVPFSR